MSTYAKIIADSICNDIRLTTFELKYPRIIHSELMTHRMFSRNARSNRYCSNKTLAKELEYDYFIPHDVLETDENDNSDSLWRDLKDNAISGSYLLGDIQGLRAEVSNRLLEPFQYIYSVVTATEWQNFFLLRLHDTAQFEIRELAETMFKALYESDPIKLEPGDWHLPYIDRSKDGLGLPNGLDYKDAIACSVARCARVSYRPFKESNANIDKDLGLYLRLLEDKHMSPFEHVATPISTPRDDMFWRNYEGATHIDREGWIWSGNFKGWVQYRQLV